MGLCVGMTKLFNLLQHAFTFSDAVARQPAADDRPCSSPPSPAMDINGPIFPKCPVNPIEDLYHEISGRNPKIPDRHAVARHRGTAIADSLYDRHVIYEGQSIMILLVRLHEIDDAADAACQKISDLLDHRVLLPVTGIITGEKSPGRDPVAPIKWC